MRHGLAPAWVLFLAAAVTLLAPLAATAADDEQPSIEFFYPLVTRRPVIERELELRVVHAKGTDGRETQVTGAVEMPLLPRWQVEVEVPLVFLEPRDGSPHGGIGDIALENKIQLFASLERRAPVAAGLETRFPSGSERRGLGGEASVEPFLTAGIALGPLDLLADVAYEWNVEAHVHGEREQELSSGIALGYRATRRFTPLLELTTVTRVRGRESEAAEGLLRGATQVSLTPGFNVRPLPGITLRFGVQVPVTRDRSFDYAVHGGAVWEF